MKYYQRKEWEKTRASSKLLYVMQHGGLRGMLISLVLVIIILIPKMLAEGEFSLAKLDNPEVLEFFLFFITFGFLFGSAISYFIWSWKESEYKKN